MEASAGLRRGPALPGEEMVEARPHREVADLARQQAARQHEEGKGGFVKVKHAKYKTDNKMYAVKSLKEQEIINQLKQADQI